MTYRYFVSYWYTDARASMAFGNAEFIRSVPIATYADAVEIGKLLEKQGKAAGYNVVVLNFILLSTTQGGE